MNFTCKQMTVAHQRQRSSARIPWIITGTVSETAWSSGTTYADEDKVSVGFREYESQAGSNTGHDPTTDDGTWWVEIDNDDAARDALASAAPETYDGLIRTDRIVKNLAGTIWEATVTYGRLDPTPSGGSTRRSFSTSGGTEHVQVAIDTRNMKDADGNTSGIDYDDLIGVDHEGNVHGCSIYVAAFDYVLEKFFDSVTTAYLEHLAELTGTVNSATFDGYAAGEVLLKYVEGTIKDDDTAELRFHFSRRPNEDSVTVGGITISGSAVKHGHDRIDVLWKPVENATSNRIEQEAEVVRILQLYSEVSWSDIFNNTKS